MSYTNIQTLFVVLCVLQSLDIYTTYFIVRDGTGYESNPVMAWLIDKLGLFAGLAAPKLAVLSALGYFLIVKDISSDLSLSDMKIISFSLLGLIAFYIYVVRNNFKILHSK
jgi:hypothetical protein